MKGGVEGEVARGSEGEGVETIGKLTLTRPIPDNVKARRWSSRLTQWVRMCV